VDGFRAVPRCLPALWRIFRRPRQHAGVNGELEDPGQDEGGEIGQETDRREHEGGRATLARLHAQHYEVHGDRPRKQRPHHRAEVAHGCLLHLDVGLAANPLLDRLKATFVPNSTPVDSAANSRPENRAILCVEIMCLCTFGSGRAPDRWD
jgi:hypothetical protein